MVNSYWSDKYRPQSIYDISDHHHVRDMLINVLKEKKGLPHILFYGNSGTGKTLIIQSFIKELYGLKNLDEMVLELNSIDERGIKAVRERIKNFAKKSLPYFMKSIGINYKMIILEEAETITSDAQTSLRRCIESYSYLTRFCIICNDISKIIGPIQSRCSCFYFPLIKKKFIYDKMTYICSQENIDITSDNIYKIINYSNGDFRKSINNLQFIYLINNKINDKEIDNYFKNYVFETIDQILMNIKKEKNINLLDTINYIINEGVDLMILIKKLTLSICKSKIITDIEKSKILIKFSNIENNLIKGADEFTQLTYLFYHIRFILFND